MRRTSRCIRGVSMTIKRRWSGSSLASRCRGLISNVPLKAKTKVVRVGG